MCIIVIWKRKTTTMYLELKIVLVWFLREPHLVEYLKCNLSVSKMQGSVWKFSCTSCRRLWNVKIVAYLKGLLGVGIFFDSIRWQWKSHECKIFVVLWWVEGLTLHRTCRYKVWKKKKRIILQKKKNRNCGYLFLDIFSLNGHFHFI